MSQEVQLGMYYAYVIYLGCLSTQVFSNIKKIKGVIKNL